MAATRPLSSRELADEAMPRLREMLVHGTTTVESKSGYGLDQDAELAMLATVYPSAVSKKVWRVGLPHFSTMDLNWTSGPPSDAAKPPNIQPTVATPKAKPDCGIPGIPGTSAIMHGCDARQLSDATA